MCVTLLVSLDIKRMVPSICFEISLREVDDLSNAATSIYFERMKSKAAGAGYSHRRPL